jgi:radical SAM protein with 4Fe4S-binding SPASM domain
MSYATILPLILKTNKMSKQLLKQEDIRLIKISDEITLFFHCKSLQIYPLKDSEIINFLYTLQQYGYDNTEKKYASRDFKELYEFICNKIATAPKTTNYGVIDANQNNYTAIVLPIAAKCNLNCPYCFAQTDKGFHFDNFTTKDIERIATFLVNKNPDATSLINIIFFGGEPLLNLPIIKFTINHFKEKYPQRRIAYSITTNGTIINNEIIQLFKENNFAILLSLDGPDNEFNLRKFRNGRNSLDKVIKNINLLKQNNIKIEFRATLVSNNPYIVETYDFFEKLEVPFNIVFAYISENKTHTNLSSYDIETLQRIQTQLDELLQYYIKKLENKEPVYTVSLNNVADVIRFRLVKNIVCGAGINYYTIMANGDIFACAHLMNESQYKIGNIESDTIQKNSVIPIHIENIRECETCWAKYLCLGGCTSQKISMGKSNDTAMNANQCELEKLKWVFFLKLYYYVTQLTPELFIPKEIVKL